MGTALKGLLPFFLLVLPLAAAGQARLSADVTVRQLHKGKTVRVEKQIFYSAGGNLVVHFTQPMEYYMLTNTLGEMMVYQPASNEVMQVADASLSSEQEFFTIFLRPDYADLGLLGTGFVMQEAHREGQDLVKTYRPAAYSAEGQQSVKVVCREGNPIYAAFYDADGTLTRKEYYSRYMTLPTLTFPTLITQISYNGPADSTIVREEYRNVRTRDFAADAPFNFKVPADARRVTPKLPKKQ